MYIDRESIYSSSSVVKKTIESLRKINSSVSLLLRSHQTWQETNFGRLRDQPGYPAPEAKLIWDILDVCISPHLPRFQVIEIEVLSIRKNFYGRGNPGRFPFDQNFAEIPIQNRMEQKFSGNSCRKFWFTSRLDQNFRKFRFKIELNRKFTEIRFENFGPPFEVVLFSGNFLFHLAFLHGVNRP